jgi:RloB-like protein
MAKSHNGFQRRHNVREPNKKYIIATEGECTEPVYFEAFREKNKRKSIFITILPTKRDGDSSPEKVLERLKKFVREKIFDKKRGECWLVIDYDAWGDIKLNEVYLECKKNSFNLAVSNPCFELWLAFHQENPKSPKTCSECQKELTRLLGKYNKANYNVNKLLEKLDNAINKASQLHQNKTEMFPTETGTHVYLLVEKLGE